ncbi:MAG: DUF1559 domain-containing protein [Planctomycetes bacterium]|nr:DUF1559 domain-containing protein [Planctomycetota bacterium]
MTTKNAGRIALFMMAAAASALLMPAVHRLRAHANGQETLERIKRHALALHACNDAYKRLPPACDGFADIPRPATVHVHLLRFLGEDDLHGSFRDGAARTAGRAVALHAPSDATLGDGAGVQNFAANLRVFSDVGINCGRGQYLPVPLSRVMPGTAGLPRSFPDGTSNTVVFATRLANCTQEGALGGSDIAGGSHYAADPTSPYAAFFGENAATTTAHTTDPATTFQLAPREGECRVWPLLAQSYDSRGLTVAMADGSARLITPNVTPQTWNQALQPNDGCYSSCWGGDW